MKAETYLDYLRDAHIAAIDRGASLTGGESMGLGERIRSQRSQELDPEAPSGVPIWQHGYSVPSESRELNAFADMALAESGIGLTRHELVDLLVNTFKIDLDELVYAWDIPTYPVMREGQRQKEGEPEFFLGNPLNPEVVNAMSGAYRPNNLWADRQGKDMSQSFTTEQGGRDDPNNALKRFNRQRVRAHPDAQGPMYEQIYDAVPNTAQGWAVEAALGMMFGPTGISIGRSGGSRAIDSIIRNFDLPPAILRRFEGIGRWLNPPGPPNLTGVPSGGESSPRRPFDQDRGPQRSPEEGGRTFDMPENMAERPDADVIPLRPDEDTYGIMTLQDIADLQNIAPSEVTEAHIREAIRAGVVDDEVGLQLLDDLAGPPPATDPAQGGLWDDINRTLGESEGGPASFAEEHPWDLVEDPKTGELVERSPTAHHEPDHEELGGVPGRPLTDEQWEALGEPPGTPVPGPTEDLFGPRFEIKTYPEAEHIQLVLRGEKSGASSVLDEWDPMEALDIWQRTAPGEEGAYTSAVIRIGDTEFHIQVDPGYPGEVSVSWDSVAIEMPDPGMPRAATHLEGLRDMSRVMDRLTENGVTINMQVDPRNTTLVRWYKHHGFELTDDIEGMGYLSGRRSPKDWFHQSGIRGRNRSARDVDFPHEEEWAVPAEPMPGDRERSNWYALGKLNGYTDDEIAHFYLFKSIEERDLMAPWFASVPGRDPLALSHNRAAMEVMSDDQLDEAFRRWQADKMEFEANPDHRQQIADAAPEVAAADRFRGDRWMRPQYDVGNGITVSDIISLTSGDGVTRRIMMVDMGEAGLQPFYLRSGRGNALGDAAEITTGGGGGGGQWVPFDGFGALGQGQGWFRKAPYTSYGGHGTVNDLTGGIGSQGALDPLFRYGTQDLKDMGLALDKWWYADDSMLLQDTGFGGGVMPEVGVDWPAHHDMTMVQGNAWGGEEGFITGPEMNELLGVYKTDDYDRILYERATETSDELGGWQGGPFTDDEGPGPWMRGGPVYAVGGVMTASDFMRPILQQDTDQLSDALAGTTRGETPTGGVPEEVKGMMAWQAQNHDGWWSWIKDYPEHLNWVTKMTGGTLDGMARAAHSTGNEVLDGLSDGFRQQSYQLATQLREGAVPLVGREDPEMLQGVSRDLSEQGHNGTALFSNDIRREMENGDAMVVGYRSDNDHRRAMEQAQRFGLTIDGPFWRKPTSKNIRPAQGQPWTREHLKKMAAADFFDGQGPR